jgi:hypothetical protein
MAKLVVWIEVKNKRNGHTFRRYLEEATKLARIDFANLFVTMTRNGVYENDEYEMRITSQDYNRVDSSNNKMKY